MSFCVITDAGESHEAFELLRSSFAEGARQFRDHLVGWQGGSDRFTVSWHPDVRLWGVFEVEPPQVERTERFWNCFGIDNPAHNKTLSIAVEMNPPHQGEDNRTGGFFLRDGHGQRYIAHTGKLGGGRPGIGLERFRRFYEDGDWQEITTPTGKIRTAIVFGPFSNPDLPRQLADYVHAVARFKREVASGLRK